MNEPNQLEPWAVAVVEKHRSAMLNELKREYVLRKIVDPMIQQVERDLAKIADSAPAKPSATVPPSGTVQ